MEPQDTAPQNDTAPLGDESQSNEEGGRALTPQEEVERLISGLQEEHEQGIESLPPDPKSSQHYKVKVNGEEVEVSLDELLRGYSRHSDYTRKTQALKREQEALERQRAALFESEAFKAIRAASESELGDFDPLDPGAVAKHIRAQVAKELQAMYAPVEQAYAEETAKAKVTAFIESKPEFQDPGFKKDVASLLRENEAMDLQTAYEVVSARRLRAEYDSLRTEAERHRKLLAEAGLKTGSGSSGRDTGRVPEHIRKQGAYAIASYLAKQKGSW